MGVFTRTNDQVTFAATQLTERDYKEIEEALETRVTALTLAGSRLIGSLLALNSRAALVSSLADPADVRRLEETGIEVGVLEDRLNAAGNNVLVNDRAALIHPTLAHDVVDMVGSLFGVETRQGTIAGVPTVGMAGVVTGKGLLLHPRSTPEEVNDLATFFGVDAQIGTVNHGAPYIGAGLVANTKGAISGTPTTGIEIGRVEDALHLY